jgi:hypothetical protein
MERKWPKEVVEITGIIYKQTADSHPPPTGRTMQARQSPYVHSKTINYLQKT